MRLHSKVLRKTRPKKKKNDRCFNIRSKYEDEREWKFIKLPWICNRSMESEHDGHAHSNLGTRNNNIVQVHLEIRERCSKHNVIYLCLSWSVTSLRLSKSEENIYKKIFIFIKVNRWWTSFLFKFIVNYPPTETKIKYASKLFLKR